jgi:hypothetical protein
MADYRQADLLEARQLAPLGSTKQQERIAQALAARERKGAREAAALVTCDGGELLDACDAVYTELERRGQYADVGAMLDALTSDPGKVPHG